MNSAMPASVSWVLGAMVKNVVVRHADEQLSFWLPYLRVRGEGWMAQRVPLSSFQPGVPMTMTGHYISLLR